MNIVKEKFKKPVEGNMTGWNAHVGGKSETAHLAFFHLKVLPLLKSYKKIILNHPFPPNSQIFLVD